MKKNLLLLLPMIAFLLPACKSSKPYDSSAGTGTYDGDYTDMSELPQRGDFNPDQDVDYSTFRAGGKENGTIYFATDSSTIASSERGKLDRIATWLFQNTSKSILIAGHCDERGTLEYNRALGEQRATSVRAYLIGLGAAANRIYTHSYGEEKPAVSGANEAAYQKNRRAEIGVVMK